MYYVPRGAGRSAKRLRTTSSLSGITYVLKIISCDEEMRQSPYTKSLETVVSDHSLRGADLHTGHCPQHLAEMAEAWQGGGDPPGWLYRVANTISKPPSPGPFPGSLSTPQRPWAAL